MTQISETTGLPDLPEGQWWEVRATVQQPVFYGEWTPFEVAIRERCTFTTLASPGKYWWSAPIPETTTSRTIDSDTAFIRGDLNPRNIRKAAFGLVAYRNRRAKQQALLGAYPPKKLEKSL